jgi:hypothetical protein
MRRTSTEEIRFQFRLITFISLGMFLFMLFFLPVDHREMEFNNSLLFIIGFSGISFIIMTIFRIVLPSTLEKYIRLETFKISNEVVIILLIWVFNTIAYIFYIRYVGFHDLTLFSGVQIVIFSGFPSVILKLADVNKSLRDQLKLTVGRNVRLGKHIRPGDVEVRSAEKFESDTGTDKFEIHPDDVMLVKSADNYVNIVYKDQDEVKQRMLRNTITNVQSQLRKYPEFLRCHRSCIINSVYIVSLTNNYMGYRLKLLDYEDDIPVSRQHILSIKEYIDSE